MKGGSYGCSAVQYSDQKVCNECGITWDVNDEDPPLCKSPRAQRIAKMRDAMGKIRAELDLPPLTP